MIRKVVDYVVGILIVLVGGFFLLNETLKLSVGLMRPTAFDKVFGILCILYGIWRIYRGYKREKQLS